MGFPVLRRSSRRLRRRHEAGYMIIREDLADFEARSARLTRKQRAVLVGVLPRTLADVIRAGLASTS